MFWKNQGITFLTNASIQEWDIAHGNTSIMQAFHLVDQNTIDALNKLDKKQRVIRVGILQNKIPTLKTDMEEAFDKTIETFMKENGLDQEMDVLSIDRDAVHTINANIKQTQFGDAIKFRLKHEYTSFIRIGGVEVYEDVNGNIATRGFMGDTTEDKKALRDKAYAKLEPGVFAFIKELFQISRENNMRREPIFRFLKEFCTLYKERALDKEYYREFKTTPQFRVIYGAMEAFEDDITDDMVDQLNISFNYLNLIIPAIQAVM